MLPPLDVGSHYIYFFLPVLYIFKEYTYNIIQFDTISLISKVSASIEDKVENQNGYMTKSNVM